MRKHDNDQRPCQQQVDFVVLTANDNETRAATGIFPLKYESEEGDTRFRWGTIRAKSGEDRIVILASLNDDLGNVPAARMTEAVVNTFHPSYIVIIGTAGGFVRKTTQKKRKTTEKKLKPGDIFVPKLVHFGTIKERDVREIAICQPHSGLLDCASSVKSKNQWQRHVPTRFKTKLPSTNVYTEHGGLVSTDNLLQGTDLLAKSILKKKPKILAADMEAGGVASALHSRCASRKSRPPGYLVIKGISDPISEEQPRNQALRNQGSPYASSISAAFACAVIESYNIPRQPTPITRLLPLDGSLEDKLHVNRECSGVLYGVDAATYSDLAAHHLQCLGSDQDKSARMFFTVCAFDPEQLWNLVRDDFIDVMHRQPSNEELFSHAMARFTHFRLFQSVAAKHKRHYQCVRVLLLQDPDRWNKISGVHWDFFNKLNYPVPCWVTDRRSCQDVPFLTDCALIGERLLLDYYDDSKQLIVTDVQTEAMQRYYFGLRKAFVRWTDERGARFKELKDVLKDVQRRDEVFVGKAGDT